MNRREFTFGALASQCVALYRGKLHGYGYVDIDRAWREGWIGHCTVLLDGRDVTGRCRWFNDRTGQAELMKHDASGRPYVDASGEVAVEVLQGRVQFYPGKAQA